MTRTISATILGQNVKIDIWINVEHPDLDRGDHYPMQLYRQRLNDATRFEWALQYQDDENGRPMQPRFEINTVTYKNLSGTGFFVTPGREKPHVSVQGRRENTHFKEDEMSEAAKRVFREQIQPYLMESLHDPEALKNAQWAELLTRLKKLADKAEQTAVFLRQYAANNTTR